MKQNLKKVKVLFFVPSFSGGGAERVMAFLINKFDRNLFEVIVVSIGQTKTAYEFHPDEFIELKVKRVLFSGYRLYRVIKHQKPDYVFSTLTYVNTYLGLLDYIFKFQTSLIARESTIPSVNHKHRKLGFFYNILLSMAYRRFKKIVCQSESMKMDLIQEFKVSNEKLLIINNPVAETDINLLRKKQSDVPIFITVAMLRKEKGIERIIDALALVECDYKYFIIGEGVERKFLEQKVMDLNLSHKISFKGFSKTPNKFLNNADVYLQGSYYEGFPNVILEAGMNGIPALVFDSIGGTNEIIINGLNGLIVKDISSYSFALNTKFWNNFDRELIIQHTKSLYNSELIINKYQNIFLTNKFDKCVE